MIERDPKLPTEAKEELMTAMRTEFEQFKRSLINEGMDKGFDKGVEKGVAQAVVQVLEARGLPVSDDARARILDCSDLPTLHRWIAAALHVQSADELLALPC